MIRLDQLQEYCRPVSYLEVDLDESLFELHMIKFILQPLVENAILHGMARKSVDGKIKITLGCYYEGVEFRIQDNGVGMSEKELSNLKNSRMRTF